MQQITNTSYKGRRNA